MEEVKGKEVAYISKGVHSSTKDMTLKNCHMHWKTNYKCGEKNSASMRIALNQT